MGYFERKMRDDQQSEPPHLYTYEPLFQRPLIRPFKSLKGSVVYMHMEIILQRVEKSAAGREILEDNRDMTP